jgi:YD repeat-containing protein
MRTVSDGRGVTSYEYDNRDRLSQITNPDGKAIGYGYDVLNNVTSLTTESGTTSYTYDALNRLDWVKDGNEVLAD